MLVNNRLPGRLRPPNDLDQWREAEMALALPGMGLQMPGPISGYGGGTFDYDGTQVTPVQPVGFQASAGGVLEVHERVKSGQDLRRAHWSPTFSRAIVRRYSETLTPLWRARLVKAETRTSLARKVTEES